MGIRNAIDERAFIKLLSMNWKIIKGKWGIEKGKLLGIIKYFSLFRIKKIIHRIN